MSYNKTKIKVQYKKYLGDTISVTGVFLKIRDLYPPCFVLESSDYRVKEGSMSYICFQPLSHFKLEKQNLSVQTPSGKQIEKKISQQRETLAELENYLSSFQIENKPDLPFTTTGIFGYTGYHAIPNFEDIHFKENENKETNIPEMYYFFFKYIIAIDHYKNELYIIENLLEEDSQSTIDDIAHHIFNNTFQTFEFDTIGEESSNMEDEDFIDLVRKGIHHCQQGDTFQIVLSRLFKTQFRGDDFQVYRALRSINPSPFLFYFDFVDFKIFGSSPEVQIAIKNGQAAIYPIAGTFKRTGNDNEDQKAAERLRDDVKENAEHVMLVDLARNDLSKHCHSVKVETFKEIQFYSHVIHLVSKVLGEMKEKDQYLNIFADTFPAGTLSGAPKYEAMKLINEYEPTERTFYGGCIGIIDFDRNINTAIVIRTFLSKNQHLYYQAGAGIIAKSNEVNELNEVKNKLGALRQAILKAKEMKG